MTYQRTERLMMFAAEYHITATIRPAAESPIFVQAGLYDVTLSRPGVSVVVSCGFPESEEPSVAAVLLQLANNRVLDFDNAEDWAGFDFGYEDWQHTRNLYSALREQALAVRAVLGADVYASLTELAGKSDTPRP